jgi:hypothetical protein
MIMATAVPAAEAAPQTAKPRKRKRVFMWTFLAIQALFVIWILGAVLSGTGASPAEIAQTCGHHAWYPLWKSYNDCAAHSGVVAAHDVGKGLAITLQIVLWCVVDFILGIGRLVVVTARRRSVA